MPQQAVVRPLAELLVVACCLRRLRHGTAQRLRGSVSVQGSVITVNRPILTLLRPESALASTPGSAAGAGAGAGAAPEEAGL